MSDNTSEEFEQFLQENKIDYESLKQAKPSNFGFDVKNQRILAILRAVSRYSLEYPQTKPLLETRCLSHQHL